MTQFGLQDVETARLHMSADVGGGGSFDTFVLWRPYRTGGR
ncbi:hypothetical protein AB0L14_21085 [Streptomyces sp. NPDC052727]